MNAAQVRKFRRKFLRDNKVALVTARLVNDQGMLAKVRHRVPRLPRADDIWFYNEIHGPINLSS